MNDSIFRKKSLDSISAPEQLDQYIKVANPSAFLALAGVIVLLVGIGFWGLFGTLESTTPCAVVVEEGILTLYTTDNSLSSALFVRVDSQEQELGALHFTPVSGKDVDDYLLFLLSREESDYIFTYQVETTLAEGIYEGILVTEQLHPMHFITN